MDHYNSMFFCEDQIGAYLEPSPDPDPTKRWPISITLRESVFPPSSTITLHFKSKNHFKKFKDSVIDSYNKCEEFIDDK